MLATRDNALDAASLSRRGNAQAATARLFPLAACGAPSTTVDDVLWLQPLAPPPTPAQLQRWRHAWRASYTDIVAASDFEASVQWKTDLTYAVKNKVLQLTLNFPELGAAGESCQQGLLSAAMYADQDWNCVVASRQEDGLIATEWKYFNNAMS